MKLRDRIRTVNDSYVIAEPVVEESEKHASKLRALAQILKDQLGPTKEQAEKAIKAAQVYQDIIDAIVDANQAAKISNDTAARAMQKVCIATTRTICWHLS